MPTINKYRTWCKRCGEWQLHSTSISNDEEDWVCDVCGEVHELYNLSEIPSEKIIEQRERYKNSKLNVLRSILLYPNLLNFNRYNDIRITESDAGQKDIDERRIEEFEKARKELEEKESYTKKNIKVLIEMTTVLVGS